MATQLGHCSIWEADVGGSGVQGHAQLPRELEVSLGFTSPALENAKSKQTTKSEQSKRNHAKV